MSEPSGSVVFKGLGGALVAIALVFWFVSVRSGPTALVARRQCQELYNNARSSADSAVADTMHTVNGGAIRDSVTCGELRARGELRH